MLRERKLNQVNKECNLEGGCNQVKRKSNKKNQQSPDIQTCFLSKLN